MAFEREVIMNVRYRVDAYDELCSFGDASSDVDANAIIIRSHIRLGSLDKIIHLSSYAKKLSVDVRLPDLQTLLVKFLRLNRVLDTESDDISSFKVRVTDVPVGQVFMLAQVIPCHALQVTYDCQETALKKVDLLHVTTSWRGSGARYDCAILQGATPSKLIFCQICAISMILIAHEWYRFAVVKMYEQKRRNKLTGHIELVTPGDERFDLCFVDSIIRVAHILPPTSHTTHSVVQDLYDGDMYLRLRHIQ